MEGCCKVSVIIPVYNVENYLQECLDSVVCQTLDDYEIICVEDCSTDKSMDILKKYATQYPMLRILEYGDNRGQAYARNKGMEIANGKYLYFMDSDDLLVNKDCLARMYQYAEKEQLDCLLFDAYMEYETEELREIFVKLYTKGIEGDKYTASFDYPDVMNGFDYFTNCYRNGDFRCVVWQQFWRKDYLKNNNLSFDADTSPHEDLLFSFKALLKVERIQYIREPMYIYRFRENSSTSTLITLKRIKAYVLCYCYAIDYLQQYLQNYELDETLVGFLNDIKTLIKRGAIDLIKRGIDVYEVKFDNAIYDLQFRLILTEEWNALTKLLSCKEYQQLVSCEPIIYGAGYVGSHVEKMLNAFGIHNYTMAVTDEANAINIGNSKVVSLAKVDRDADRVVILAVNKKYRDEMERYARTLGFNKIIYIA